MEPFIAGITAAFITLFDLDRIFYIPKNVDRRIALNAWWWGFIITNGILAAAFYNIIKDIDTLKNVPSWIRAIAIGISYLAVIRLKFTTFNYQGKEFPFGLETFYEAGKGYVFKRINSIAKDARFNETMDLAKKKSLGELATQCRLSIEHDQLLTQEDKHHRRAWLLKVLSDASSTDLDKCATIADYVLSGQQSSDII